MMEKFTLYAYDYKFERALSDSDEQLRRVLQEKSQPSESSVQSFANSVVSAVTRTLSAVKKVIQPAFSVIKGLLPGLQLTGFELKSYNMDDYMTFKKEWGGWLRHLFLDAESPMKLVQRTIAAGNRANEQVP
jgi:hypothetical protein